LKYKHLTIEERYHIQAFKKAGYKNNKIAKDLGVSDSTVSRELKRNSSTQRQSYSAINANKISNDRWSGN
jgi:IS30 family transposase